MCICWNGVGGCACMLSTYICVGVCENQPALVWDTQSCPTVCDPMARILDWVAVTFSRGSSQPRDRTQVSSIAGGFSTS